MPRLAALATLLIFLSPAASFAQGIPIEFTLDRAGYITIVIEKEDEDGDLIRVRNLIQDEHFTAGRHVVQWDGYGMGTPVRNHHARYDIIEEPILIGDYHVRALFHEGIDLKYEFSVYQPGNPPWQTSIPSSGWLGEHGAPASVAFLPNGFNRVRQPVLAITSVAGEVYRNTAYVDLDGNKVYGNSPGHFIMHHITTDRGSNPSSEYAAYLVTDIEEGDRAFARVFGLLTSQSNANDAQTVASVPMDRLGGDRLGGLAAWNGYVFVPLTFQNRIGVIDANNRAVVGFIENIDRPRGMDFSPDGYAYVAQGENRDDLDVSPKIVRYRWNASSPTRLTEPHVVVGSDLEAPQQMRFHQNELFVSDWGYRPNTGFGANTRASHQVKVFDPGSGSLKRTIGRAGGPQLGRYDEQRMHRPRGFDIDSEGKLWVAENDFAPRRVSVWNAQNGNFIRAIYGNSKYAGGGSFDPTDASRMFYATPSNGGGSVQRTNETIEFHVDWQNPENSRPKRILWRQAVRDPWAYYDDITPFEGMAPELPFVVNGDLFLTNWHQNGGGREPFTVGIWKYSEQTERLHLVSVIGAIGHGDVARWSRLNQPDIHPMWNSYHGAKAFVSWTDHNRDGKVQSNELSFRRIHPADHYHWPNAVGTGHIGEGLVYTAGMGFMVKPRFTSDNLPVYDLDEVKRIALVPKDNRYGGDGPQSVAYMPNFSSAIHFGGPITGYKIDFSKQVNRDNFMQESYGKMVWQYHVQTPSSSAAVGADYFPRYSGDIHRMMRYINAPFSPDRGEAGDIVAISAYHGSVHVMTHDGFYLTDLGADSRLHGNWMDVMGSPPFRGKSTQNRGLRGESYFHTLNKLSDGRIIFQGGGDTNLFLVEGFETVRRMDLGTVTVTPADLVHLDGDREINTDVMENRRLRIYSNMDVTVNGQLNDWPDSLFVEIDRTRMISAALASDGEHLFAAWRTQEPMMLNNPQTNPLPEVFRGGGGLDLFIASSTDINKGNPTAVPFPRAPRAHKRGDYRIFITKNGNPGSNDFRVYLFEKVNPLAHPDEGYAYYSPIYPNGIRYSRAVDVSEHVQVAQYGSDFEVAVPLRLLDKVVWPGKKVLGDLGVVIGNGETAISRSYWNNQSRIMTNDLPTEAEWWTAHMGLFEFVAGKPGNATAPIVNLSYDGSREVFGKQNIRLRTSAGANSAPVQRVEYFANHEWIGEGSSPPFELNWQPGAGGRYIVTARGIGSNGSASFTSPDTIVVWQDVPAGWSSRDITRNDSFGYDGAGGETMNAGTVFALKGTGQFLTANGGTNHHMAYRTLKGDFDVQVALIGPNGGTSHNSVAGITVRRDLNFDTPHAIIVASKPGYVTAWNRPGMSNGSTATSAGSGRRPYPIFFRIVRQGNQVNTYYSASASNWELVSSHEIDLNEEAIFGLVAGNGDGGKGTPQPYLFDAVRVNGEMVGLADAQNPPGAQPRVTLSSPRTGATFTLPATVELSADIVTAGQTLERVVFVANGADLATVTSPPFEHDWHNPPLGEHFVSARAYFAGTSTPVSSSAARIIVEAERHGNLQKPWNHVQIGNQEGGAQQTETGFSIWASGPGTENASFVYQPNTVEVEITARASDVSGLAEEGAAGLMARETLDADAPFVSITTGRSGELAFAYRKPGTAEITSTPLPAPVSDARLRLVRSGSTFTAYVSSDGSSWTDAGSVVLAISNRAHIGLFVSPGDQDDISRAEFDDVTIEHVQHIPLVAGWNFVSAWVSPAPDALEVVTRDISDHLMVMKDIDGDVYAPEFEVNQLRAWAWSKGYGLLMSDSAVLTLRGQKLIPELSPIQLKAGWNKIPVLMSDDVPVVYALRNVAEKVVILKDIHGNMYMPDFGVNTIGMLKPGVAYQVFMTDEQSFVYPSYAELALAKSGEQVAEAKAAAGGKQAYEVHAARHYSMAAGPSAFTATLILNVDDLENGDEIAVKTEAGELVGSAVISEGRAIASLIGRGTGTWQGEHGAEEGEVLQVFAWSAREGVERRLVLDAISDITQPHATITELAYRTNAIFTATGTEEPSSFELHQNYPNPFNPSTTIQYSIAEDVDVTISVFNALGQRVATLVNERQNAGSYTVTFEGSRLASGVYIYQIRAGGYAESRRMMLVK